MLAKLAFLSRLAWLGVKLLPKTFVDLPKIGVPLVEWMLNGFDGVPNEGCGKCNFDVGPAGIGDDWNPNPSGFFLHGVSGMP